MLVIQKHFFLLKSCKYTIFLKAVLNLSSATNTTDMYKGTPIE